VGQEKDQNCLKQLFWDRAFKWNMYSFSF